MKWTVRPDGGFVMMLYEQDSVIDHPKLYIYLDKKGEGSDLVEFDSRSVVIETKKSWVAYEYKFNETGEYVVTVLDPARKELARGRVIIEVQTQHITTSYYTGTQIIFCEDSKGGEAHNADTEFEIDEFGGEVTCLVKLDKPLNSSVLIVDIWKKKFDDFDKFIEAVKFRIEPEWKYAKFSYEFSVPGEYRFMLYNEDEVWINSADLEIIRK